MKKTNRLLIFQKLICPVTFIICLASCYDNIYFGKGFFESGPTNKIDIENWAKVKIGMTKKEVIDLLGDSPSKHILSVESSKKVPNAFEFWEYEYRSSLLSGPHPKAYVIYFDKEGLVSRLQEPMTNDTNVEKSGEIRDVRDILTLPSVKIGLTCDILFASSIARKTAAALDIVALC